MAISVQLPRSFGQRPVSLRGRVEGFIHHPAAELVLVGLILASVVLLVVEAGLDDRPVLQRGVGLTGDVITWIFVVELALRFWVAPKKRRFFRRYWLDLVAVLPVTRALRLFRLLRVLRLFRAGMLLNRRMSVFRGVITGAGTELTVLVSLTATLVLAAAVILHVGEGEANPALGRFDQALWFSVNSLVAGEPIGTQPVTATGRSVTLLLMLGGITVFGMFVGTVSAAMVTRLARRLEVKEMDLDELTDHVVVCGWNHAGTTALEEVFNDTDGRRAVVLITEDEGLPTALPDNVPLDRLYHVSGDYTRVEVLEQANISRASVALLLSDKTRPRTDQDRDARTVLAALTIERLSPGIFTCAELRDRQNATLLKRAGVEEIVVTDEYGGLILGSVGRNRGLVSTLDEILSTRYGNAFHRAALPPDLVGTTVGRLHGELKTRHQAVLVSVEREVGEGRREVQVNPPESLRLALGDELVVIARQPIDWARPAPRTEPGARG